MTWPDVKRSGCHREAGWVGIVAVPLIRLLRGPHKIQSLRSTNKRSHAPVGAPSTVPTANHLGRLKEKREAVASPEKSTVN